MGSSELASPGELSSRRRPCAGWYDVFMSFRGKDTSLNFTDHLYAAFVGRGIVAFRDDIKLQRDDPISANLVREIDEFRFCIIVFSANYASSTSCLDEMEKIYDCMRSKGSQTVLPVFYYVDPSNVRKHMGGFEEASTEDESTLREELGKGPQVLKGYDWALFGYSRNGQKSKERDGKCIASCHPLFGCLDGNIVAGKV